MEKEKGLVLSESLTDRLNILNNPYAMKEIEGSIKVRGFFSMGDCFF
jgi:hypothetical protein